MVPDGWLWRKIPSWPNLPGGSRRAASAYAFYTCQSGIDQVRTRRWDITDATELRVATAENCTWPPKLGKVILGQVCRKLGISYLSLTILHTRLSPQRQRRGLRKARTFACSQAQPASSQAHNLITSAPSFDNETTNQYVVDMCLSAVGVCLMPLSLWSIAETVFLKVTCGFVDVLYFVPHPAFKSSLHNVGSYVVAPLARL